MSSIIPYFVQLNLKFYKIKLYNNSGVNDYLNHNYKPDIYLCEDINKICDIDLSFIDVV